MKKVLIIKLGAIGDLITALPMVPQLKEKGSHITWVVSRSIAPLCRAVQGIDQVIEVDEALLKGSLFQRFFALFKISSRLFLRSFDRAIIAHADPRYRLLALFVRAKEKRFFSRDPKRRISPVSGRYRGDEYLRLIDDLEGPIEHQEEVFPVLKLPEKSLVPSGTIVLVPGGAKNLLSDDQLRRWPLASYVSLAKRLIALGYPVALVGAPHDAWTQEAFQGLPILDLIGKTDLMTLIRSLQTAALVISHDTGPLHMARAVGTQVIGLFGPINPHEVCGKSRIVLPLWEAKGLACAPCYDGKRYAACQNGLCMKAISVEQVLDAALNFLSAPCDSVARREESNMIPEVGAQDILARL